MQFKIINNNSTYWLNIIWNATVNFGSAIFHENWYILNLYINFMISLVTFHQLIDFTTTLPLHIPSLSLFSIKDPHFNNRLMFEICHRDRARMNIIISGKEKKACKQRYFYFDFILIFHMKCPSVDLLNVIQPLEMFSLSQFQREMELSYLIEVNLEMYVN